jgi:hypothetical protein
MVRVRFAGGYPRKKYFECGFFLKRKINSPRFSKIDYLGRDDYIHRIKIYSTDQFDSEFKSWLKEAYKVGEQKHLLSRSTA